MLKTGSEWDVATKSNVCLWYGGDAEAAARFYADTLPDSSMDAVRRGSGDSPSGK